MRLAYFYETISGNFERSQYFNFYADFLENGKLFQKTVVPFFRIENASFPYNTAISEANIKTNRIVSKKRIYHKVQSFASNYFILF